MVITRFNASPSVLIEICVKISRIIKDFCGAINEEVVRKNFALVYEILEEIIDFGYLQSLTSDQIKPFISNKPVILDENKYFFN